MNRMMQKSILFGGLIGAIAGTILGATAGLITTSQPVMINCAIAGLILGIVTGASTGWLTVRTAGTTGGVSMGAYTGMAFGALIGAIAGAFIPDSMRLAFDTTHTPLLDVLTASKFEFGVLVCFLASVAGTAVGAWVGGKNLIPRDLTSKK
ncbi:MAG: hypothetical protein U0Z26_09130 [Anaerolineales bacterium]